MPVEEEWDPFSDEPNRTDLCVCGEKLKIKSSTVHLDGT